MPPSFEGRSLVPLLVDAEDAGNLPSYAALTALLFRDAHLQRSLNDGAWTYARNEGEGDDREFLFDRSVDPEENVNLVEIEHEQAERLRSALDEHLAQEPVAGAVEQDIRIDPGLAQKLRALGYMQ